MGGYFARGQIREPHKKKLQKFGTGYFARGQIREPHRYLRQGCSRQKRQCMALAPGMLVGHAKKKIAEVWHGVFRTGTNSGTSKKNCRSLARGISLGDKFGNLKKNLQKFGTGYFARGQIREPHRYLRQGCSLQKRQCMALAPGM